MKEITAIKEGKGSRKRVSIFLDGKLAFNVEPEVALKECLQVGERLATERIEALTRASDRQRCRAAALNFLSYRPRSEFEVRERLQRRGFDASDIEAVIGEAKEDNLLDDASFARFWEENRDSFKPRSQWLVKQELKRKGVSHEVIDQVTRSIDDNDMAYRAAVTKARSLSRLDYLTFRRRLGDYLRRRGFSYEVISPTVARLWQELAEANKRESCP